MSSRSSTRGASATATGSSKKSNGGASWRSAPDDSSFARNQRFAPSNDAVEPARPTAPILKPVFLADDVLKPAVAAGGKNRAASDASSSAAASSASSLAAAPAAAVLPVQSSRTMKATAPITRAPVQVIDAGQVSGATDACCSMRESDFRARLSPSLLLCLLSAARS